VQNEIIQSLFFAVACFTIIINRGIVSPVILSTIFFDSMNLHWMSQSIWGYDYLMSNLERAKWAITMQKICPQEKLTSEVEVDPKVWPLKGEIEFKDVRLRYRKHLPEVLQGLSFKVEAGDKIGLVGRTGAGKSTICLVIPRIVEALSGSIEIDGIDISKVDLHTLRNKITVVP
jgi:ABC-type multidrug transport system fused ATPase/permease subunit